MARSALCVLIAIGAALAAMASSAAIAQPSSEAAAASSAAASAESPQLAEFRKAIRAKYDIKERGFATHDADLILTKFYTEDALSVSEGGKVLVGRAQLKTLYDDVVKHYNVKVESVYPFVNANAGWDWTNFTVLPLDPKEKPFTAVILFLWTKVNGHWMCKGDISVMGSLQGTAPTAPKNSHSGQ